MENFYRGSSHNSRRNAEQRYKHYHLVNIFLRHPLFRGVLVAFFIYSAGCSPKLGPDTVERSRQPYNEALARTQSEQLLLNIVRLRYRDTPLFLKVGTLTTQYNLRSEGGASSELSLSGDESFIGPFVGFAFEERPTVTYTPLQGEEFVKQLLKPLPIESLMLLSNGGWSVERIFRIAVQEMNGIGNAKTAAGPTPRSAPNNALFQEVGAIFRKLQQHDRLRWFFKREETREVLMLEIKPNDATARDIERLHKLLNLKPSEDGYALRSMRYKRSESDIAVSTRSLLSALFFLSQGISVPQEHEERGVVTVTKDESTSSAFRWKEVLGNLFQVSYSREEPKEAWPRVFYRNHWFYIEEDDLNSKSTFMLLSQLLSLQSGGLASASPALTLSVGG